MEQTFVVTYKGGKGKGFAETEQLIKAASKKEARDKIYDLVPGVVIKKVEKL